MKFVPSACPVCGERPKGTLEDLEGVALLGADGLWEGYTDILWDSQKTRTDAQGRCTLICKQGHEWQASQEET